MTKIVYNKLVRDLIPDIIIKSRKKPNTRTTKNDEEFSKFLGSKLLEEIQEYIASSNLEELADILEVIYAILDLRKITFEELEILRIKKKHERGSFTKRVILLNTTDF